jgi:hypothetical protein
MEPQHIISEHGNAVVVCDDHFPVVIATWFGKPDVETINFYFEWQARRLARARDEETKVVTIIDVLDTERPPASVRKTLADQSEAILGEFDELIVHSWVVVDNVLVRGALTAISWITPMRISTSRRTREALEEGCRALLSAGIGLPSSLDPASYQRPTPPEDSATGSRRETG